MALRPTTERSRPGPASVFIESSAVLLAALYVAPHVWWMFGVSAGFPGDGADLDDAFRRTWFVAYNLITTGLVLVGAFVVIALERRWAPLWRRSLWLLVLCGAIVLLLRGALGIATSIPYPGSPAADLSLAALAWELWFILTGALYALVARRNRASRRIPSAG